MIVIFGYARNHPDRPCAVDVRDETRTICGRTVELLPQIQAWGAEIPLNVHDRCRFLIGLHRATVRPPDVAGYAPCPECSGDVPVGDDGTAGVHNEWTVGRHGLQVSSRQCGGSGQLVETP